MKQQKGKREARAVYAGSFDPVTKGHEWIMREGARLFEDFTVAIAVNPAKKYTFTLEKRREMICGTLENPDFKNAKIAIETIGNEFLVDWANDHHYTHLVRGIRSESDFEFERTMLNINRDRLPTIETVFLIPPRGLCEISSSMVKSFVGVNGWESLARNYASPHVIEAFHQLLQGK